MVSPALDAADGRRAPGKVSGLALNSPVYATPRRYETALTWPVDEED